MRDFIFWIEHLSLEETYILFYISLLVLMAVGILVGVWIGRKPMLKRCSNCKHCRINLKALQVVYIMECRKKGHCIVRPFWEGWRCKEWRAEDGN